MNRRLVLIASVFVLVMFCSKAPETATTATAPAPATASTQAPVPAPVAAAAPSTTPAAATPSAAVSTAPAAAPAGPSLQSQETNWAGVTAEVTEFRRKGNTLTGKVRLTNKGTDHADVESGKKYEVLKDEKGTFISSVRAGYTDRWAERIEPATSQVIWMKFPAPPPEVKTITLQLPKTPPFDDLQIQD